MRKLALKKSVLVMTAALVSFVGAGIVFSGASQADRPASTRQQSTRQQEALFGSYRCSAGPADGFLSLVFNATGDVFDDETNLFRSVAVPSTPGETCEFHTHAALDSISPRPCAVSAVEASADETGATRSFQFVCRAGRPTIIRVIADVSEVLLTSGS
jgi:hypothetical protein